jgi:hypothetical protein
MKIFTFVIGVAVGLLLGSGGTELFLRYNSEGRPVVDKGKKAAVSEWAWPDSLDAVKAAPENHKVVYEDDRVRILEVLLRPYEFEYMHTHKFPSVMIGSRGKDTSSFAIVYYRYRYDSSRSQYVITDSTVQHGGGSRPARSGSSSLRGPEGPHAIKNLSNVTIDIFRIEFKK